MEAIKYPIFLPDIGTFFDQDISLAKRMIDELAKSGVNCIKTELLHNVDICLPGNTAEQYFNEKSGKLQSVNYRKLIERKVVKFDDYEKIFDHVRQHGLHLAVSVYDLEGLQFANSVGAEFIKIPSSNITHLPLIESLAAIETRIIIDTGHSTLEEISRAINTFNDCGRFDIIIEHSPPGPPSPLTEHNLKFMDTLRTMFQCNVGLSDHHSSTEMIIAAVALGACVLEKGVRPDNHKVDQDTSHAINVSEVKELLVKIENISNALGDGVRHLRRDREKYKSRMGVVSAFDLQPGDILTNENVRFAFPCLGIQVEQFALVDHATVIQPVKAGNPIRWRDIVVK